MTKCKQLINQKYKTTFNLEKLFFSKMKPLKMLALLLNINMLKLVIECVCGGGRKAARLLTKRCASVPASDPRQLPLLILVMAQRLH